MIYVTQLKRLRSLAETLDTSKYLVSLNEQHRLHLQQSSKA